MDKYILKNGKKLRCGYTTGSCVAAATKASILMLLTRKIIYSVEILTPSGIKFITDIDNIDINENYVSCSVKKDGGDDIDATNGMDIYSKVTKCESGINIYGGEGIGKVTRKGLKVDVGKSAINPVPLKMIEDNTKQIFKSENYNGGINILIYAPKGREIAKKTFNEKLGIIGGISILGTSGIVEPMSESAILETIKTEIDVFSEKNKEIILITIGNYGRDFVKNKFKIDLDKGIKCSNFIGETIDYACYCNFKRILLIGHIGKLIKIAGGIMNTHSRIADCRMEILAAHCALCGIKLDMIKQIMNCITVDEAIEIISKTKLEKEIFKSINKKIKEHLIYRTKGKLEIEFIIFDSNENIIMFSEKAFEFIEYIKFI